METEKEHANYENTVSKLAERGATLKDIALITFNEQSKWMTGLTLSLCLTQVKHVLKKREIQHIVWTGLELDRLVEENKLHDPIESVIKEDFGLYGVDEILGTAIATSFGAIGTTGYGYIDNTKPGIIGKLDKLGKTTEQTTTFIDDLVGGIAAAAGSLIAQKYPTRDALTNLTE